MDTDQCIQKLVRTEQEGLKKNLNEYTCSDIPQLHEEIAEKYSNLLSPLPLKLPPFHEVSHEIPLIDESKWLKHRLPRGLLGIYAYTYMQKGQSKYIF